MVYLPYKYLIGLDVSTKSGIIMSLRLDPTSSTYREDHSYKCTMRKISDQPGHGQSSDVCSRYLSVVAFFMQNRR